MDRRTIRTNQCWLIDGIIIFGEFFWLFKRALSGKVMDVLGTLSRTMHQLGNFTRVREGRNQLWVLTLV
jgi:hypothetical protein